jgi:ABC-type glutathione transport system ATPase component
MRSLSALIPSVPLVDASYEPTGNFDEDTRDEIIGLLETTWRERGLTLVLVTHDSTVARRAQRIGVMKNGRLTFRKPARAQAARPQPTESDLGLAEPGLGPSESDLGPPAPSPAAPSETISFPD